MLFTVHFSSHFSNGRFSEECALISDDDIDNDIAVSIAQRGKYSYIMHFLNPIELDETQLICVHLNITSYEVRTCFERDSPFIFFASFRLQYGKLMLKRDYIARIANRGS